MHFDDLDEPAALSYGGRWKLAEANMVVGCCVAV